jgi:hypothetical protein
MNREILLRRGSCFHHQNLTVSFNPLRARFMDACLQTDRSFKKLHSKCIGQYWTGKTKKGMNIILDNLEVRGHTRHCRVCFMIRSKVVHIAVLCAVSVTVLQICSGHAALLLYGGGVLRCSLPPPAQQDVYTLTPLPA